MTSDTVTIPRAELVQIQAHIRAAVDAAVAIGGICECNDDGLPHELVCAISVCNGRSDDAAAEAWFLLREILGEEGHA